MKKVIASRWRDGVPVEDCPGFKTIKTAMAYAQAHPVFGCTWTVSVYKVSKKDFWLPNAYKVIQVPETVQATAPATL